MECFSSGCRPDRHHHKLYYVTGEEVQIQFCGSDVLTPLDQYSVVLKCKPHRRCPKPGSKGRWEYVKVVANPDSEVVGRTGWVVYSKESFTPIHTSCHRHHHGG